jgi:hypothetical protein
MQYAFPARAKTRFQAIAQPIMNPFIIYIIAYHESVDAESKESEVVEVCDPIQNRLIKIMHLSLILDRKI